jgi:hypothetical protein
MNWPSDADGDVMRRLQSDNFDFDREVEVDFNIDFDTWPPHDKAIMLLKNAKPNAQITVYNDDQYVLMQLTAILTYSFVISTQAELTEISRPFGGRCESWGVYWDPKASAD